MKSIVFIGDSIVEGAGDDRNGGWTHRLAARLPDEWLAIHAGVGGNTILDLLARVDRDVIAIQPNIAILGVGINDSRMHPSQGNRNEVPLAEFQSGLSQFADLLTGKAIEIFVVGLTPVDESRTFFIEDDHVFTNKAILAYDLTLKEFAVARQIGYIALFDEFRRQGGAVALTADGLHPNPRGHQLISDLVWDRLKPRLRNSKV